MSEQHKVYLGVPGLQFCWGTVTGVVNSSAKHVVRPFNGGLGFSGVVDFNLLWTDAHNLYDAGEITHFAMLHGDITPDPAQRWLDILLDIMDEHEAAMVSAVSPIKDMRGLTSSGICDPDHHWEAYRRFTQREVLNDLPETFDNVAAGYPDNPLLHNTAMWACDLRNPAFHATNPDGTLKFTFRFPEKIVRGEESNRWEKYQESEDWLFSRELWEAGVTNTWITSKPRLTHHGKADFQSWNRDFGNFRHGDDNTAHRWRKDTEARPLALTQMLEFELGSDCNLGKSHVNCPNTHPERYGALDTTRVIDDDTIVDCAVAAYRDLGFTGLIGWIYYNEPLLEMDRMFGLMDRIKAEAPKARFILWSNGMLVPEDCTRFAAFSQIVISEYNEASAEGFKRLEAAKLPGTLRLLEDAQFDNRMIQIQPTDKAAPCLRPFVEFIVDNHGNVHLCCYDWQGWATPGNILDEGFAEVATRWRDGLADIAGDKMTAAAPDFCQRCGHRWSTKHQAHDQRIMERANRWRKALRQPEEAGV